MRQACDVPYGHAGSESGVGERGLIGGRRLSAVLGGALGWGMGKQFLDRFGPYRSNVS